MYGLPTLECYLLFGFTLIVYHQMGKMRAQGRGEERLGIAQQRRDKVSGGPGLVSVMGDWPRENRRRAYT